MQKNKLTDYLTENQPFGPEDAALIHDPYCKRMLFQGENNIYSRLRQHPTYIIGRKGSGKTAFLHSGYAGDERTCIIDLNSASAFALILRTVQSLGVNSLYVEPVAKLWEMSFWLALMFNASSARVGGYGQDFFLCPNARSVLRSFLAAVDPSYDQHTTAQFLVAALGFYRKLAAERGCQPEAIADLVVNATVSEGSFGSTQRLVMEDFEKRQLRALLTIDSLDTRADPSDKYDIGRDEVNLAITGLLKCLGAFSQAHRFFDVRFCLPSERYYEFLGLSSNPAKDIVNSVMLRWTAGELMCIAAHRLSMFWREHVSYHGHHAQYIEKLEPHKKRHASQILEHLLGGNLTNNLGQEEDSISFVMRHTQLLPRHVLALLNSICSVQKEAGQPLARIGGQVTRQGVARVEEAICHEVFAAYRHLYPRAEQVCAACIPELAVCFDYGALHVVFNQHGKRAFGSEDFDDFRRMLVEMGIIGRVMEGGADGGVGRHSDRYILGMFEYAAGRRMVVGTTESMCLHPLFSELFRARPSGASKVVYPYGSDISSDEQTDFYTE